MDLLALRVLSKINMLYGNVVPGLNAGSERSRYYAKVGRTK